MNKKIIDHLNDIFNLNDDSGRNDDLGRKSVLVFIESISKSGLLYYYDIDFTKFLLDILEKTDSREEQIIIIECIMFSVGINGYSSEFYKNKNNIDINFNFLADKYINLIAEYSITENTEQVLVNFIEEGGISSELIFNKASEVMTYEKIIMITYYLHNRFDISDILYKNNKHEILKKAESIYKNKERIYIIYKLFIITHPDYYDIFSFTEYFSDYKGIFEDWYWINEGSSLNFVSRGIISEREGILLEQIGKIIIKAETSDNMIIYLDTLKDIFCKFCKNNDIIGNKIGVL